MRVNTLRDDISVSKSSEFFIAMMLDHDNHSYVTLGVKSNDRYELLAGFGKNFQLTPQHELDFKFRELAFASDIKNEAASLSTPVRYKAFALSYKQYLHFLQQLGKLKKGLQAYYPTHETNEDVTLTHMDIPCLDYISSRSQASNHLSRISLFNNCRHTAITLTKDATQANELGNGVSSLWFRHLPYKTEAGFYVLPTPPSQHFPHNKPIFQRLEAMIANVQATKEWHSEFEYLKSLCHPANKMDTQAFETASDRLRQTLATTDRENPQKKLGHTILAEINGLIAEKGIQLTVATALLDCTRVGIDNPNDMENVTRFTILASVLPNQGSKATMIKGAVIGMIGIILTIASIILAVVLPGMSAMGCFCALAITGALMGSFGIIYASEGKQKPLSIACSKFWQTTQDLKTQNLLDTNVNTGNTVSTTAKANV
jgi:hypothetical protein